MLENSGSFPLALNMSEQVCVVGALPFVMRVFTFGTYRVTETSVS